MGHIVDGCFERAKPEAAFEPSVAVSSCATHFHRPGDTLIGPRTRFLWGWFGDSDLQARHLRGKVKDIARLYPCAPLLERLAQDFEDMVVISDNSSLHKIPWSPREISSGRGTGPPMRPTAEMGWCGARKGRAVTRAGWEPVRLAMRWLRAKLDGRSEVHISHNGRPTTATVLSNSSNTLFTRTASPGLYHKKTTSMALMVGAVFTDLLRP